MIGALRHLPSVPMVLALISAGLAGIVALQLWQPAEAPPPAIVAQAARAGAGSLEPPDPYLPRPLESYRGIAERPLFSPSRRPTRTGAAAGRSSHDSLTLAGVILTTSKRLAMLETKQGNGGVVVVREGQVVEGWSVETIAADRVVISHDDDVVELLLDDRLKAPRKEVRRTPRTAPKTPPAPAPANDAPAADAAGQPGEELAEEPEQGG